MSWSEMVGSWRVALRLAGRAARRRKARTLLLILMLMLPVYAGSVLVLSWSGTYASPDTVASWQLGQADFRVDGADLDLVEAALPAGSRVVPASFGRTVVRGGGQYTVKAYETADLSDPIHNGRYVIRAGRAPRGATEVALSTSLAEALQVEVGSTLVAGLPQRDLTVVGIVDVARELATAVLIAPTDHPLSAAGSRHLIVDLPTGSEGWSPRHVEGVGSIGWMSRTNLRESAATDQALQAAGLILVIGFAGGQTALLVAAAFAVSAQRQRRELAMMGAVGASRPQVARMVLANGVLLGAVAGAAGVALGIATFQLSRSQIERIADHPLAGTGMPAGWLAGIGLFAVVVGVVAALGPARGLARDAIRASLTDREGAGRAGNLAWLTTGLTVAAGGALATALASGPTGSIVTVAAGSLGVLFGIAALAPTLVAGCGRIAARCTPAGAGVGPTWTRRQSHPRAGAAGGAQIAGPDRRAVPVHAMAARCLPWILRRRGCASTSARSGRLTHGRTAAGRDRRRRPSPGGDRPGADGGGGSGATKRWCGRLLSRGDGRRHRQAIAAGR